VVINEKNVIHSNMTVIIACFSVEELLVMLLLFLVTETALCCHC
jgi:hypothetical protein